MQIEKISINEKEYPQQLKNIYDPPQCLYVLGNKNILNQKGIAIVGSRKCTNYGKEMAIKISEELSKNKINIISGLAIGIDSYAHFGNIKIQNNKNEYGKTIAVLGSGIDQIYPKQNVELARKIIQTGGCIISEYPIGTMPKKEHFPQRNRIISGLSIGVVIVEAQEKSGALITADFAIEQGREVFAVPGDVNKKESIGSNQLIKDGAKMVTSIIDILEEMF